MKWAKSAGFTIVELLIVIVVIGILAAITIVAYNGIQGRAYDVSVQSDLEGIAKQIKIFETTNGRFPQGDTDLGVVAPRVTKSAYGNGLISGGKELNILYCWPSVANPNTFAIIASSKAGHVFQFSTVTGIVTQVSYAFSGSSTAVCSGAGAPTDSGTSRDFFYYQDAWQSYVKG